MLSLIIGTVHFFNPTGSFYLDNIAAATSHNCLVSNISVSPVSNGKHEWVPKEIAQEAEKFAKVSFSFLYTCTICMYIKSVNKRELVILASTFCSEDLTPQY